MAKTISQSITSIETTETSLESSLSKCKTSISNKGVSVSSSAGFSNLPALIDKIQVPKKVIKVATNHLDNTLTVQLMVSGSKVEEYKNLYHTCDFEGYEVDSYTRLRYFVDDAALDYSSYYLDMGTTNLQYLNPNYFYVIVDDPSKIDSVTLLTSTNAKCAELGLGTMTASIRNVWSCSLFHCKSKKVNVNFKTTSGLKVSNARIPLFDTRTACVNFVILNTANRSWTYLCMNQEGGFYSENAGTF